MSLVLRTRTEREDCWELLKGISSSPGKRQRLGDPLLRAGPVIQGRSCMGSPDGVSIKPELPPQPSSLRRTFLLTQAFLLSAAQEHEN